MPENALMKQEDRKAFVQVQDSDVLPELPPPCGMSSTKRILSDEVTPKSEGLPHLLSLDEFSLEGLLRPDSPVFLSLLFPPAWAMEWHKHQMAAISSETFDSLLKTSPEYSGCRSNMATFVITRSEPRENISSFFFFVLTD